MCRFFDRTVSFTTIWAYAYVMPTTMHTPRRTFRIPDPLYDAAKDRAEKNEQNLSKVVRASLRQYLADTGSENNMPTYPDFSQAQKDGLQLVFNEVFGADLTKVTGQDFTVYRAVDGSVGLKVELIGKLTPAQSDQIGTLVGAWA